MAKPNVFISSTYYDLKTVRADIHRFLSEIGFEATRHELGHIPYGKNEKLESSCIKEVENCDILVCVIGGKFGSQSSTESYSITQKELKSALDFGKQVFIFVDRPVHHEYKFYLKNKSVDGVQYTAVDDRRVYEFLEEINSLPKNNSIFGFETSADIISILREQFAAIFQRLLSDETRRDELRQFEQLKTALNTVDQLVKYLSESNQNGNDAIKSILSVNHPIFEQLKQLFKNRYRIYFSNLVELNQWLFAARGLKPVPEGVWDDANYREWVKTNTEEGGNETQTILKIKKSAFDEKDRLISCTADEWNPSWVTQEVNVLSLDEEDEIPF